MNNNEQFELNSGNGSPDSDFQYLSYQLYHTSSFFYHPSSESVHEVDGPSSKIRPLLHHQMIILVQRPNFFHQMDVLSPILGLLFTWTDERVDRPQTAVFVRRGLPLTTPDDIIKQKWHPNCNRYLDNLT